LIGVARQGALGKGILGGAGPNGRHARREKLAPPDGRATRPGVLTHRRNLHALHYHAVDAGRQAIGAAARRRSRGYPGDPGYRSRLDPRGGSAESRTNARGIWATCRWSRPGAVLKVAGHCDVRVMEDPPPCVFQAAYRQLAAASAVRTRRPNEETLERMAMVVDRREQE